MLELGLDPLLADRYTPYELTLLARQKAREEQHEFENLLCLAWHTEAFARQKRLPRLEKILRDTRKKPTKKPSASDALLKAMAAEKGVKLE